MADRDANPPGLRRGHQCPGGARSATWLVSRTQTLRGLGAGAHRGEGCGGAAGTTLICVMRFEKGPNGKLLCAPPRTREEAQAWIDATGKPSESRIGPNGQIRPPRDEDWG